MTLSTVVFCTLAIEARANHVIQKLREANRITKQEARPPSVYLQKRSGFFFPSSPVAVRRCVPIPGRIRQ